MAPRCWSAGHPRRPSHAEIAATPIERLPPQVREEAAELLRNGSNAIADRLASPSAKVALQCQGVDLSQLTTAADVVKLDQCRAIIPARGQKKKLLSSADHSEQLLGQIIWEESFCIGRGISAEDGEPNTANVRYVPRPPATRYPPSRPASAQQKRYRIYENRLNASRNCVKETGHDVENARANRENRLTGVQIRLRERLTAGEDQIGSFQADQRAHMHGHGKDLTRSRQNHVDANNDKFDNQASSWIATRLHEDLEQHFEVSKARRKNWDQHKEHYLNLALDGANRRACATERKGRSLQGRTSRQTQQATARELAQWQNERLNGLRSVQKDMLRSILDEPAWFSHKRRMD